MKVKDVREKFNLDIAAGSKGLDREVKGGYCGDLLSDVMANTGNGDIWFTVQAHQNILAVAVLKELAGIIIVNGHKPDEETTKKANDEGIPILTTGSTAYRMAGELFSLGIGKE
ncbi:MAG: serine kinase [Deltaproteobacteria bacterium]|nr:serine kinase [Deltaproteobacteria bacterium]